MFINVLKNVGLHEYGPSLNENTELVTKIMQNDHVLYMGQFNTKTNQSEGRGKLMHKDGSLLYEGYHLNNKFNNKGRLILYDTMKF